MMHHYYCKIFIVVILCAGAGVLLWDGTNRFNKVNWHCHHHSSYQNTTLTATFLRGDNITSNNYLVPGLYYDDDDTSNSESCVGLYDQACAEYAFGIFIAFNAYCVAKVMNEVNHNN